VQAVAWLPGAMSHALVLMLLSFSFLSFEFWKIRQNSFLPDICSSPGRYPYKRDDGVFPLLLAF